MQAVEQKKTFRWIQISMILAPLCFVISWIVMAPQQDAYQAFAGKGPAFLSSLRSESTAWLYSHLLLLAGAVLYLPALVGLCRPIINQQKMLGVAFLIICCIGLAGIIGQLALDFVYGVLSNQTDLAAMEALRLAIIQEPVINLLFYTLANVGFVSGMILIALTASINNWLPRMTGVLIIAGWLTIILLHGKISYIEAVGHSMILGGFVLASLRS